MTRSAPVPTSIQLTRRLISTTLWCGALTVALAAAIVFGWLRVAQLTELPTHSYLLTITTLILCIPFFILILSRKYAQINQKYIVIETELAISQASVSDALIYNRNLIEANLDPMVTLNTHGFIIDLNKATEIAAGLSREAMLGTDFCTYFTEPELARTYYLKVISSGFVKNALLIFKHTSGRTMDVMYNASLYYDLNDQPAGIFAVAHDVTSLREAQKAEKIVLSKLEHSNQELQQFVYIASHDLQEPLRVIANYIQLIERRYTNKLDQDAHDFINFAVEGVNRLQRMINDLLSYSRLEVRHVPFTNVDVTEVVRSALDNLKLSIDERSAVITYDALPVVLGDEVLLTTCFQNLLSNAIKFSKKGDIPIIHIGVSEKDGAWVFRVTDNGIGIDLAYKDKLFVMFKRLVGRDYPGNGIGLAICKKLVERHGGSIWVESTLNKGSTFYFSIPKSNKEH